MSSRIFWGIILVFFALSNSQYLFANQIPSISATVSTSPQTTLNKAASITSNINQESNLFKIIVAALGGFLGWIFIQCVVLYLLRQKLLSYLIVVINAHFNAFQDIIKWLNAVKTKTIKQGYVINTAATLTKDDLDDMRCVRDNCFKLLFKKELISYIKISHRMWETETLLEGLCKTLTEYKESKKVLDESDIDYLNRKLERVLSYIAIFPVKISKFGEIPSDFKGVHGAEVLVGSDSAKKPS